MRAIFVIGIALVLSGCAESEVYVLKNPKTGETRECHGDEHSFTFFPIVQNVNNHESAEACARGYEAAGWQRMN